MKYSGVSEPLKLIGGKWKIAILHALSMGPIRFGELKRNLSPITQQMLTKQLRELEKDDLINRKVFDVVPPKVAPAAVNELHSPAQRLQVAPVEAVSV